jgi:hypothetical protein
LLREANSRHVFITPDGPQGPRRELKSGIVFLASQTGIPIIPTAFSCSRAWVVQGSWTDLLIPKPFSDAYLLLGTPIHVPPDISRDELERYRLRIQGEMDRLDRQALDLAAGRQPPLALQQAA